MRRSERPGIEYRLVDAWERFGRRPAFWLWVLSVTAAVATVLVLGKPAIGVVSVTVGVMTILYCVARPDRGWDTFLLLCLPNLASTLVAESLLGIPRLWGLVLVPVVLVGLWRIDHTPPEDDRRLSA